MMVNKRIVAVFDFDGTITTKDTFVDFIRFCYGPMKCYWGFLLHLPLILLMKLHFYPNWKCKQKVFKWFFSDVLYSDFSRSCEEYSLHSDNLLRKEVVSEICELKSNGATIYVVSASITDWVRPICLPLGVDVVLGTEVEINQLHQLTGNFSSKNCYGQEKVERLLRVEPKRSDYYLIAYGDSRGDKEMLEFADKSVWV